MPELKGENTRFLVVVLSVLKLHRCLGSLQDCELAVLSVYPLMHHFPEEASGFTPHTQLSLGFFLGFTLVLGSFSGAVARGVWTFEPLEAEDGMVESWEKEGEMHTAQVREGVMYVLVTVLGTFLYWLEIHSNRVEEGDGVVRSL